MNLDFSPFTQSKRYLLDKEKLRTSGKRHTLTILLIVLGLFIPFAWPFLAIYIYTYYKNNKIKHAERLRYVHEFADKNGFEFTEYHTGFASATKKEISVHLPFGDSRAIPWYELQGTMHGRPFNYVMASIYFQNNQNKQSVGTTYSILSVELPVPVPKLFINSKYNTLYGFEMKVNKFEQAESFSLEGDFPQYYDVIAEKNDHINMYTVLTPEVMDTLKRNDLYDIWLSGKYLTIITSADIIRYFAAIPDVFENAAVLMKEIDVIQRSLRAEAYVQEQGV